MIYFYLNDYDFKLLSVEQASFKTFQLNDEAEHIVENGSHEAVVFKAIPDEGILQAKLMVNNNNIILFP
jgi:hypothetical protein